MYFCVMSFLHFFGKLVGLLLPSSCVECGSIGTNLCTRCDSKIRTITEQVCPNCRAKSPYGNFCSEMCLKKIFDNKKCFIDGIIVCCCYEKKGVIEKLISKFKYKFSDEIKNILCPLIVEYFDKHKDLDFSFVLPVPLHIKREKMRGFNQSELLADAICTANNMRKLNILKRTYNTFPQAKLNRSGRLVNLTNAFAFNPSDKLDVTKFCNKNFLIIDDVCTTGSTLNECARVLRSFHPGKIYGLVLARG